MVYLILLCLLVLLILTSDLFRNKRGPGAYNSKTDSTDADIMGPVKSARQTEAKTVTEGQPAALSGTASNFTQKKNEEELILEILQEGPDDTAGIPPDWEEEEEELKCFSVQEYESGYATGVTFEELSTARLLFGSDAPETALREAADTVQKIDGTDLLLLLESALGESAQKLALLFEPRKVCEQTPGPSTMQDDLKDFDISTFL